MALSASALLLAAIAPSHLAAADITPSSLAVLPNVVELGDLPYDWSVQQRRGAPGIQLAQTAHCNTQMTRTNINNQADEVPDCGFD